nr:rna polymerase-associated protein rtf1 [Quercus suber]
MSDDGLDAELLGMVGDGSDDEGEEMASPQQAQSPALSVEAKESVEQVEDTQSTRKGVAQKVRAKGGRKKRKAPSDDEDEFGDEPSPSPPKSLGSGAMEESDADAPASPDAEVNLYPLEGRYMNTTDRDEILAMPEIKREAILAERQEEIMKKQQNMALKRVLAGAKGAAKKYNKRKASAAELDDEGRRTTRPKAVKTTTTALDNYKKAREAKGNGRERSALGRGRKDDRSSSSSENERDADGESEVEWAAEPSSDPNRGDEPLAELRDFERCRIGRSNFAKVCFYPGFIDAMEGCFARVNVGLSKETGFVEGKPYHMMNSKGNQFMTNQYILVTHGLAEKAWPFTVCSNSNFTNAEFDLWTSALQKDNIPPFSKRKLLLKLQGIHNFLNHQWTNADIDDKMKRQKEMVRKCDPDYIAEVRKEAILKRKEEAEQNGDADEEIRAALLRDRARLKAARAAAVEANRIKAEAAAAQKAREERRASGDDLFEDDEESDLTSAAKNAQSQNKPALYIKSGTLSRPAFDDEILKDVDFGIDIEI